MPHLAWSNLPTCLSDAAWSVRPRQGAEVGRWCMKDLMPGCVNAAGTIDCADLQVFRLRKQGKAAE